jgi:hypothetical protein
MMPQLRTRVTMHRMSDHDHDHVHSTLGEMDLHVRALETVLAGKGVIDPAALDVLIDTYQTRIGPRNGARVVARAWSDSAFRDWLRRDAWRHAADRTPHGQLIALRAGDFAA